MAPSPSLTIDTSFFDEEGKSGVQSASALKPLSSLRISVSPVEEQPYTDLGRSSSKAIAKGRNETRKLLSHLLTQLQARPMPPTIYDFYLGVGHSTHDPNSDVVADSVKAFIRRTGTSVARTQSQNTASDDDSDNDVRLSYSTDYTYGLMLQIRDVFVVCNKQEWLIFDDDIAQNKSDVGGSKATPTFRRSRSSFQGNRPQSPSPARDSHINSSALFLQCVSVLSSVVQEECRYKAATIRLYKPSNALHAVCLDIAQFLAKSQWCNPQLLSHVAQAMVPAFSTFPKEMQGRLLRFYEDSIIRSLLEDLRVLQTGKTQDLLEDTTWAHSTNEDNASVTIQIFGVEQFDEERKDNKHSDLPKLAFASTYAPSQSRAIYHMASIVPPLLSAIVENVEITRDRYQPELHDQLRRLLVYISQLKFDAGIDFLQVIAFHSSRARLSACALLLSLWRNAVGHIALSEPLTDAQMGLSSPFTLYPSHSHQFLPWRFSKLTKTSPSMSRNSCHACANEILGFGLVCHLCTCSVHFDCYDYPAGCSLSQYAVSSGLVMQKAAMFRFCGVLTDDQTHLPRFRERGHRFQYLNLFTLCPCYRCRKPLWGCILQAIGCAMCSTFFHPACFTTAVNDPPPCKSHRGDSSHLAVDWETLRGTCIDFYREMLPNTQSTQDIQLHTLEETSIYFALLWIQLQLLTNGIALGSIIITHKGRTIAHISEMDAFELQDTVCLYQTLLDSDNLRSSQAMDDYLFENHLHRREHNLMFDWSCLLFISTAVRGPYSPAPLQIPSGFLNATQALSPVEDAPSQDQLYGVVSISHIRGALEHVFNIVSELAVHLFLQHLSFLGFIQPLSHLNQPINDELKLYTTILPFGFDSSAEVEILIAAIEACLSDENLSINEFGFLLLIRRLLPNGMSSEYALRRLARSVIAWILTEDLAVATVLRDFVAKMKHLPGVPLNSGLPAWPERVEYRAAASSSINGGDYIALRRVLRSRYAATWLLTLHDQDPVLYAEVIYDACADFANMEAISGQATLAEPPSKQEFRITESVLRCIIKLSQAMVTYSAFDRLISRWMSSASMLTSKEPMATLQKVFSLERSTSMCFSVSSESAILGVDNAESGMIDPWRPVLVLAGQLGEELARSLDWLDLLASAGVQIPGPYLLRFVDLIFEEKSLANIVVLSRAAFKNAWLNPLARQDIPLIFSKLHVGLSASPMQNSRDTYCVLHIIRLTLASCLLAFGCDKKKVFEMGMVKDDETQGLPLRKMNNRSTWSGDPITIDAGMMNALEVYIDMKNDEISSLVAKFFNAFLTDSPFMEMYEVDNFILRNGKLLAKSVWQFYNVQMPELYEIRASLLSRTIVVDSQPYDDLFHESLLPTVVWEGRLSAITRLFRIIEDITNPAFEVEGRYWRSSVTVVFYCYFKTLWTDDKEEVRLAIKTSALTLRPAHLQAMQLCWTELLTTAPIPERVRLLSFLYQLSSYFPGWKVLSWRAVTNVLSECEHDRNSHNEVDRETSALRLTLLLLSLQMVANGASVNLSTLLQIKKHLVDFLGFANVTAVLRQDAQICRIEFGDIDTVSSDAAPCIDQLIAVFDSSCPFELTRSSMTNINEGDEKPTKLLVGAVFVDVALVMFCTLTDLLSFPVFTLKRVLESLSIIVYKHNFENPPLIHLQPRLRQAVSRCLVLIFQDIAYELRQVTLSFIQGFIRKCNQFMGPLVYKTIEQLGKLIAAENRHPSDALVIQAKSFLEETLTTYASNGLFANLLKRSLPREFFLVLKETFNPALKDTQMASKELKTLLLHDVITRTTEFEYDAFQIALDNLSSYIDIVHNEDFSPEYMSFVGQQLVSLAKRAASDERLDPSPLFIIPSILCENNQTLIRDIIHYVETEIRIILTRTSVTFASLFRLLCATKGLQRRNASLSSANNGNLSQVIFEILSDGLKQKARVQPFTLATLIQVIVHDDSPDWLPLVVTYPNLFLGLIDNSLHYLLAYEWPEGRLEDAYNSSISAARLVWRAIDDDVRMTEKLAELGSEKQFSAECRIRAWNVMALVALQSTDRRRATIIFPYLGVFSDVQFLALRPYIHFDPTHWDPVTANINHAYIAIKLWILLAGRTASDTAEAELATSRVWNELWPPFETLAFNVEKQSNVHPALALLISSSVADLFIFLHSLHTPLSVQTASHTTTLERLKNMTGIDAASRKISRAITILSQPLLSQHLDLLVDQASKDILAAEKLRILESRKDAGRGLPEKRPQAIERHARMPTN